MFFHVAQSLVEFVSDTESHQFHFVLYKFHKGKEKFKKRYELYFDGSRKCFE